MSQDVIGTFHSCRNAHVNVRLTSIVRVFAVLSYSFDIYQNSRVHGARKGISSDPSADDDQDGDMVVVFRDQQTADAVTASPAVVRLFLEETGFGFSTPTGTAPSGYVRANNDAMRRSLKRRISKALSNQALERALDRVSTSSAFDVRAFILSIVRGKTAATQQATPQRADTTSDPIVMPDGPVSHIVPRRPGELQGRGIKSRMRPQ